MSILYLYALLNQGHPYLCLAIDKDEHEMERRRHNVYKYSAPKPTRLYYIFMRYEANGACFISNCGSDFFRNAGAVYSNATSWITARHGQYCIFTKQHCSNCLIYRAC